MIRVLVSGSTIGTCRNNRRKSRLLRLARPISIWPIRVTALFSRSCVPLKNRAKAWRMVGLDRQRSVAPGRGIRKPGAKDNRAVFNAASYAGHASQFLWNQALPEQQRQDETA
jgi:hypothetical protein